MEWPCNQKYCPSGRKEKLMPFENFMHVQATETNINDKNEWQGKTE